MLTFYVDINDILVISQMWWLSYAILCHRICTFNTYGRKRFTL